MNTGIIRLIWTSILIENSFDQRKNSSWKITFHTSFRATFSTVPAQSYHQSGHKPTLKQRQNEGREDRERMLRCARWRQPARRERRRYRAAAAVHPGTPRTRGSRNIRVFAYSSREHELTAHDSLFLSPKLIADSSAAADVTIILILPSYELCVYCYVSRTPAASLRCFIFCFFAIGLLCRPRLLRVQVERGFFEIMSF